jgi:Cu(I)/Ag(I) efflux system membrane fusion protein
VSDTKKKPWLILLLALFLVVSASANIYYFTHRGSARGGTEASAKKTMYVCPMHPTIVQDHPGDCPICGMKLVPMKNVKAAATPSNETAPAVAPASADKDSTAVQTKTETIYTCPMDPQVVQDKPGKCPICGMNLVKKTRTVKTASAPPEHKPEHKIVYYRSPMDPKVTSPVPRKDEMGMDYVPVYEDELNTTANAVPDRAEVTIDPERQQLIGLKTSLVTEAEISGGWSTVGRVQADETQIAKVNVKVSGYVEQVFADFVGKPVQKGEPLFTFYSPELYTAQQEYLLALKSAKTLAGTVSAKDNDALIEAVKQKLRLADVTEADIERLEKSGEPRKDLTMVSPVSGVVTTKNIVEGSSLMPGAIAYEITDLSTVWVMADAYQSDLERVKVGMPAVLTLQDFGDQKFTGKVAFIDPTLNPQSRTLKVRINFPNPKGELKPDMFGEVKLEGTSHEGLTIPADAIVPSGTRSMVFVAKGDGKFAPREVTLGATSGERVEVVSGLKKGESVVSRANFLVDSESSLRAALADMQGS